MTSFRPSRGLIATPLAVLAASVVMLLAAGSSDAPAASSPVADGALKPTTRQRALAPRIAELLEQQHYSRQRIDDAVSAQVFDRYLEMLDSQHSYLTAADIASFAAQRTRFDDMIHSGALEPAFDMFSALRAAQPRARPLRHRPAGEGTGLDRQRDVRIRSRQGARGPGRSTN